MSDRDIASLAWEVASGATPRGRICGVAILALVLRALGPDRIARGPNLCALSVIIRHPCPACGITRASAALLRGDLRRAVRTNRLILPVALVGLVMLCRDLREITARDNEEMPICRSRSR